MFIRRGLFAALASLAGCTGIISAGQDAAPAVCAPADNPAPAAPVMEGFQAREIIVPANLRLRTSVFSDPDGDVHAETQFEVWILGGGAPLARVWSADVTAPTQLLEVGLDDGTFDAGYTGLDEWTDYAVRARHRDADAECPAWGEFSPYLEFRSDDSSAFLFDEGQVLDFELEIPPESWGPIDAEAIPPGCVPHRRSYYTGTLTFGDQVFENVGVRAKGGCGSARNLSGKAGFKINLEWDDPAVAGCPAERRLYGQKHFTFNNSVQDQSFIHERLGYSLYHALGVPAPRAATIRLFVNGEYWGVYNHVESFGRRFLDRWFASPEGMLYEGTYWCDLLSGNVPPGMEDTYCLTREFAPSACDAVPHPEADPQDYEPLRDLVDRIAALPQGGFYPEVTDFFEFDDFFTTWAIESLISHWDAYQFSIMNNYRVYHDPATDKWTLLSSGIDQTFGGDQDPWGVSGVLAWRCIQEPECEAAFAARLHEVTDYFEAAELASTATSIHDLITSFVYSDPRKEFANDAFEWAVSSTIGYIGARPARVREILTARGY